jgi:S1-C subfamily serine protease
VESSLVYISRQLDNDEEDEMYGVKNQVLKKFLIVLVLGFVLTGSVFAQSAGPSRAELQTLEIIQGAFRSVARKVIPSVVKIDVVDIIRQPAQRGSSPFDFFFAPPEQDGSKQPTEREFRRPGLGSGVIVRRSGNQVYALTNNHVVGDAEEIRVTLSDHRQFDAKLVGKDEKKDWRAFPWPTWEIRTHSRLEIGPWLSVIHWDSSQPLLPASLAP